MITRFIVLIVCGLAAVCASVYARPHTRENRLAVVMPIIGRQLQQVVRNWESWEASNRFPCALDADGKPRNPGHATLVMYLDTNFDRSVPGNVYDGPITKHTLTQLFNRLNSKHCFRGGIEFIGAELSETIGHPDGPCLMFYHLFELLERRSATSTLALPGNEEAALKERQRRKRMLGRASGSAGGGGDGTGFDHLMLMETDVFPIRKYWLDAMIHESSQRDCRDWWMKGSAARCDPSYADISKRLDRHMNGNALYCLNDAGWRQHRVAVQAFYAPDNPPAVNAPGCATGQVMEGGYDHALYQYRHQPVNFKESQFLVTRFQYTNFIQNMCESEYSAQQIRRSSPHTFLVHSKWVFFSAAEQTVRRAFRAVFDAKPSADELKKYINRVRWGELNYETLTIHLCAQPRLFTSSTELCRSYLPHDGSAIIDPSTNGWAGKFPSQYYLLSVDFHPTPIVCNAGVFAELGIVTHAEVDFPLCEHFGVCKDRLKVLSYDDWRGFSLDPCPHQLRRDFFEAYKTDPEMARVDVVVCSHPAANCELFMALNRTLIVYPTTRLEFGRADDAISWRQPYIDPIRTPERGRDWLYNLHQIAASPSHRNVVAANSLYDVLYIKYLTGLDAYYLPSWCGMSSTAVTVSYAPTRREILIGPTRDNLDEGNCADWGCNGAKHPIMMEFRRAQLRHAASRAGGSSSPLAFDLSSNQTFVRMKTGHRSYSMADIASYPAMILFPYQASIMSAFEFYRLNIPLFAPSQRLLIEWQTKYQFLFERVYGHPTHNRNKPTAAATDSPHAPKRRLLAVSETGAPSTAAAASASRKRRRPSITGLTGVDLSSEESDEQAAFSDDDTNAKDDDAAEVGDAGDAVAAAPSSNDNDAAQEVAAPESEPEKLLRVAPIRRPILAAATTGAADDESTVGAGSIVSSGRRRALADAIAAAHHRRRGGGSGDAPADGADDEMAADSDSGGSIASDDKPHTIRRAPAAAAAAASAAASAAAPTAKHAKRERKRKRAPKAKTPKSEHSASAGDSDSTHEFILNAASYVDRPSVDEFFDELMALSADDERAGAAAGAAAATQRTRIRPSAYDPASMPDPNSNSPESLAFWIAQFDVYTWPHVTYFDSFDELIQKLHTLTRADLWAISHRMSNYNSALRQTLLRHWRKVFGYALSGAAPGTRVVPNRLSYDDAMHQLYGTPQPLQPSDSPDSPPVRVYPSNQLSHDCHWSSRPRAILWSHAGTFALILLLAIAVPATVCFCRRRGPIRGGGGGGGGLLPGAGGGATASHLNRIPANAGRCGGLFHCCCRNDRSKDR